MNRPLDLSKVKVYSNTKEDAIKALSLIGQDIYMSDDEDFSDYVKGELIGVRYANVSAYVNLPFLCRICGIERRSNYYKHFILCKDAKFKEEKKLRPFKSISEFCRETGIKNLGDTITIRIKNGKFGDVCIFNGYRTRLENNQIIVFLGVEGYTLEELKDDYCYLKNCEWKPFGMEE